jgi:hypothetical protein
MKFLKSLLMGTAAVVLAGSALATRAQRGSRHRRDRSPSGQHFVQPRDYRRRFAAGFADRNHRLLLRDTAFAEPPVSPNQAGRE